MGVVCSKGERGASAVQRELSARAQRFAAEPWKKRLPARNELNSRGKERAMELKLKPISKSGITEALSKVTHYRYLNQFDEAESISRDVIAADPDNQRARRML